MSRENQRHGKIRILRFVLFGLIAILLGYAAVWAYRAYSRRDRVDPVELEVLADAELKPAMVQAATGAAWPQWRGPFRDGISREMNFRTDWTPENFEKWLVWKADLGGGYSSVVVADGRVCTMTQDGNNEVVVCWDESTGKELWRFAYRNTFDGEGFGPGPRSTPAIDGDRIYTVGSAGVMHCLKMMPNSDKGEVIWKKHLLAEFNASNLRWGISFSPLIIGDLVYTIPGGPSGASIVALDKYTGEVRWQALNDPGSYSSPVAATLAGRLQVVFLTGYGLVGLDPEDGTELWRYPWTTDFDVNAPTPIVVGDYVFVTSGYNTGCAAIHVSSAADGRQTAQLVYKNKTLTPHFSSCVFFQDHVYGFKNTVLMCMNFRTGQAVWKQTGFQSGSLLIAGDYLIVLGERGTLALAKASAKEFQPIAEFPVLSRQRCWSVPVLANGRLYLRDEEELVCFDLRKN